MNEYDQIRNMLGKVRLIKESFVNSNQNDIDVKPIGVNPSQGKQQQQSNGEKIQFDDIKTIGFMNINGASPNVKNSVVSAVGEFIKNTGLILDTVNITVEDSRILITSNTIKNPNIDTIKSITFDTNEESPIAEVISGRIELSQDLISLFQSINLTYNDNQIGRNGLVTSTQGGQ